MKIHFVCEGNTYRSRLAEAYFNSKVSKSDGATSSGTRAAENLNGPISWVAAFLLTKNHLISFMANGSWVQTSREILEQSDNVVFMDERSFDFAKDHFGNVNVPYEVWDIPDVSQASLESNAEVLKIIGIASETFISIQKKVDFFIEGKNL